MGFATAQGLSGIAGFVGAHGAGWCFSPAQGGEGMWSPLSLGTSLAAWYKADAGCYTDAACLFASASSQYLSKTSPTFAPTTKMTIAVDFKPSGMAASHDLVSRYAANNGQFIFRVNTDGTVCVFIMDSLADSGGNFFTTTAAVVSDGVNARIVVIYDGTLAAANRVAVYVDGSAAAGSVTGTIPTSLTASTAALEVGRSVVAYTNGSLARLGFSSLALSGAALTAAHTSTFWADMTAARQADWFSFYNLCEASGTRVDSTGLNNLTPTNGPTVAAGPGEGLAVNNSPVKRIADQSGAGLHATQSTITKQGLWIASAQNGRPGILFDGSDDYYAIPSMSYGDFTKVLATKWTAAGMVHERNNGATDSDFIYRSGSSWQAQRGGQNSAYDDTATGAAWMDGTYIITHRYAGTHATHVVRRNGSLRAATNTSVQDPGSVAVALDGTLGARVSSLFSAGHFMEMVLANAALSDPQTVSAESYMNTRYAIY